MKDLIKKQKIMLNRFLSWSDFGIEREERVELENLISKVRKETAEYACNRIIGLELKIENPTDRGIGYNKRIKEEKEIKKQILNNLTS